MAKKREIERLRIGIARGTFQILHPGHVKYLRDAAALVDRLYVFIDSDQRVEKLKGECYVNSVDRTSVLLGLKSVHNVIVFSSEKDFQNQVEALQEKYGLDGWGSPYKDNTMVYFKGGDYKPDELQERNFLQDLDIIVCCLTHTGHSTTDIIKKIRDNKNG